MPLIRKRDVRTWGAIPDNVDVAAALCGDDGSAGVVLLCDDEPTLALPVDEAKRFLIALTEAIVDAEQLAERCGPNVRKANKAQGN